MLVVVFFHSILFRLAAAGLFLSLLAKVNLNGRFGGGVKDKN